MITVTSAHAKSALALIEMCGTPEAAAHDCAVQLRAIEPYTDARLSRVRDILLSIARKPARLETLRAFVTR